MGFAMLGQDCREGRGAGTRGSSPLFFFVLVGGDFRSLLAQPSSALCPSGDFGSLFRNGLLIADYENRLNGLHHPHPFNPLQKPATRAHHGSWSGFNRSGTQSHWWFPLCSMMFLGGKVKQTSSVQSAPIIRYQQSVVNSCGEIWLYSNLISRRPMANTMPNQLALLDSP